MQPTFQITETLSFIYRLIYLAKRERINLAIHKTLLCFLIPKIFTKQIYISYTIILYLCLLTVKDQKSLSVQNKSKFITLGEKLDVEIQIEIRHNILVSFFLVMSHTANEFIFLSAAA